MVITRREFGNFASCVSERREMLYRITADSCALSVIPSQFKLRRLCTKQLLTADRRPVC